MPSGKRNPKMTVMIETKQLTVKMILNRYLHVILPEYTIRDMDSQHGKRRLPIIIIKKYRENM